MSSGSAHSVGKPLEGVTSYIDRQGPDSRRGNAIHERCLFLSEQLDDRIFPVEREDEASLRFLLE